MKKLLSLLAVFISLSAYSQTQYKPNNPDSLKIPIQINGVIRYVYLVDLLRNVKSNGGNLDSLYYPLQNNPSGYLTGQDGATFETKSHAGVTYQPIGDYARQSDLSNYYDKTGVDTAKDNLRAAIAAKRDSIASNTDINIKWFNPNVGDSVTPAIDAFNAAKAVVAAKGGGTIYFPAGKYPAADANGWLVGQSNIKLKGDGEGLTVLLPAAGQVFGGLQMAPYRDAGWQYQPSAVYTFEDSAAIGQDYIVMKVGQDLSKLTPGTIIFINDGASHYDQMYGEPNTVYKVQGNRVYLKDNLSRDYTVARGSWRGITKADFVMPDTGQTVTVPIGIELPNVANAYGVSINNNLFQVMAVSSSDSIVTLKNMGKGNQPSGTIVTAGAHVMKGREIIIASSMVHDVTVEDMTVVGRRKALTVSNSYNTYFKNVQFKWLPASDNGGGTIDGDDGKYATLDHCIVEAPYYFASQLARSFVGFKAYYTTFHNSSIDFTEFATGEIDHCTFDEGREVDSTERLLNNPAITVGGSAADLRITNNTIRASNRYAAIASNPDIQVYNGQSGNGVMIDNNYLYCNNCTAAFDVVRNGAVTISNNKIFGALNYLFNVDGGLYADTSNQRNKLRDAFTYVNTCKITGNTFGGYIDAISNRRWHNVEFIGNDINRFGSLTTSVTNNALNDGNIIKNLCDGNGCDSTPVQRLIVKNNTFRHWDLNANSFRQSKGIDSLRMDISLNYIYDNVGVGAKDSIVTLFTPYDNRYKNTGAGGSFTGVTVNTGRQVQFYENADGTISIQLVDSGSGTTNSSNAIQTTEGQTLTTTEGETIQYN